MNIPFASPMISLPAYRAPIWVAVIIITFATTQRTQALQIDIFRPINVAIGPNLDQWLSNQNCGGPTPGAGANESPKNHQ
jgi:hypothetical protein